MTEEESDRYALRIFTEAHPIERDHLAEERRLELKAMTLRSLEKPLPAKTIFDLE